MKFQYKKTIFIALALALSLVVYALATATTSGAKVVFLNVGQGDATLVSLPGETQILIDGGPSNELTVSLGRYIPFYDRTIELVILTHPHADHLRGINEVLDRYKVENVMFSGVGYDSEIFKGFINRLENEGAQVYIARAGDTVVWDNKPILRVLSPDEYLLGQEFKKIHESTVVSELVIGGVKFLLTGDIEEALEKNLLDRGVVSDVDVLKVAHHGSKTSSSFAFLNAALPETAVVSVGKNSFGHPAEEVINRLKKLGSKILRTDEAGDIVWTFQVR